MHKASTDFCPSCGQTLPDYSKALVCGDWILSYPCRVVFKGVPIRLSEQQFNAFEKIVRNHAVHQRMTGSEELWAYLYPEGECDPNTSKVIVWQLRNRLPIACIETVYKHGYIFHPDGFVPLPGERARSKVATKRNVDRINVVVKKRKPKNGK